MGKAVTLIIDPVIWAKARIIAKRERRSLSAQITVWIEQQTKPAPAPAVGADANPDQEAAQ